MAHTPDRYVIMAEAFRYFGNSHPGLEKFSYFPNLFCVENEPGPSSLRWSGLGQVSPRASAYQSANARIAGASLIANVIHSASIIPQVNSFSGLALCNGAACVIFSFWVLTTQNFNRMNDVFFRCAPLNILNTVIGFYSVLVIALGIAKSGGIGKRIEDYSMKERIHAFTVFSKAHLAVSILTNTPSYNAKRAIISHSRKIAHRISSLKTFYWTPLLDFCDNWFRHFRAFLLKVQCSDVGRWIDLHRSASILNKSPLVAT